MSGVTISNVIWLFIAMPCIFTPLRRGFFVTIAQGYLYGLI